jgi:hypothetical protein
MALNFPSGPASGQKYPASPVAGVPTYSWDGEKWTTGAGNVITPPIGEAPNDGVIYARRNMGWVRSFVQLTKSQYNALSPPDPNVLYIIKN